LKTLQLIHRAIELLLVYFVEFAVILAGSVPKIDGFFRRNTLLISKLSSCGPVWAASLSRSHTLIAFSLSSFVLPLHAAIQPSFELEAIFVAPLVSE
jgi:hypothetical protein